MKFLILNHVIHDDTDGSVVQHLALNREFIKWMEPLPVDGGKATTAITVVGMDETIDVIETITEIEEMCQDVQLVRNV